MKASMRMLFYTYYLRPWKLESGDNVRIHTIVKAVSKHLGSVVIVYNLSHLTGKVSVFKKDNVVYINFPRKVYRCLARLLKWNQHHDLNPLMKLTHYVDELIAAIKLAKIVRQAKILYIFGSMTLFSLFLRLLLRSKETVIIYDPLANYAQTLYLRSRRSRIELIRYGLYLMLHRLQLKYSDYVVYPSKIDLENAKRMFNVKEAITLPNPMPVCYENIEEYVRLRTKRKDFSKPYFILLAGGKGKGNEEAVRVTIEVFNELPPNTFRLYITGPWQDLQRKVRNPSIKICGIVSERKLKELLAVSDYGLAPVFSHASGTFLKVLAYIAAGLHIITFPWGLQGIDIEQLRGRQVFIVKSVDEYRETVLKIVSNPNIIHPGKVPPIAICKDEINVDNLLKVMENIMK